MCTVSVIPISTASPCESDTGVVTRSAGVRLACNRDELRTRPAALPPVIRVLGRRRAILPIDPVSDGTWIAVNDAGIAAALLNVNPGLKPNADDRRLPSRGTLIPRLMAVETFDDAAEASIGIHPSQYAPFRLVIIDDRFVADFYSDGRTLRTEHGLIQNGPRLFTSSGLGDALVEGPRRDLFARMVTGGPDGVARQDAFHRHAWPDRRHLSVCMERNEARTVSHTVIEIEPERVVLTYVPDAPDRAKPLAPTTLARTRARK